jgi:hypothetical protein
MIHMEVRQKDVDPGGRRREATAESAYTGAGVEN